jgi:hypothetical protein
MPDVAQDILIKIYCCSEIQISWDILHICAGQGLQGQGEDRELGRRGLCWWRSVRVGMEG